MLAVDYYKAVAKWLLPHIRNRPLSFKRYPGGLHEESFWEKDAPSFTPKWVKRFPVPRREGPPIEYIIPKDTRTLTWIAQIGGLELHPFLHTIQDINTPTHVAFDLDPGEGADILDCARVALLLRELLESLGLQSFAKVSGSKGMQVYLPLNTPTSYAVTQSFARLVAEGLAQKHPTLIVSEMTKALRRKKVFIDWSQNTDYKTTVAVYSLRATGFVSMPVHWREVERSRKLAFTPEEAVRRVGREGDVFAGVLTLRQHVGTPAPGAPPSRRLGRRLPAGKDAGGPAGWKPALPKATSQSGRRLFVVATTGEGTELWLEAGGVFRRFLLQPRGKIAPRGEMPVHPAYYRGEVPAQYAGRMTIQDTGAYEIITGSWAAKNLDLWFNGQTLKGRWKLEKGRLTQSAAFLTWPVPTA